MFENSHLKTAKNIDWKINISSIASALKTKKKLNTEQSIKKKGWMQTNEEIKINKTLLSSKQNEINSLKDENNMLKEIIKRISGKYKAIKQEN